MPHLVDSQAQDAIAASIDTAVQEVLVELDNHGSEEGVTPALGSALRRQSFQRPDLEVTFNYRQTNKITEEPHCGADGGFLVSVNTPSGEIKKTVLFQAKLLSSFGDVRGLRISSAEAERLKTQSGRMLTHTAQSVVVFYTRQQIYVVDAADYSDRSIDQTRTPLEPRHRLLTLGTYLGKWVPRCSKGDTGASIRTRVEHLNGLRDGIDLRVVTGGRRIAEPSRRTR